MFRLPQNPKATGKGFTLAQKMVGRACGLAEGKGMEVLDLCIPVLRSGVDCPIVTGAGTGTWEHELASGVWNELQPGSYVFMDADYARNTPGDGERRFEHSLFVLAAVMSTPCSSEALR